MSSQLRILLTGGRAFVTLDLARQFNRAGHDVVVAESIPEYLCRYSRVVKSHYQVPQPNGEPTAYIDALIEIIQQEQIDLLLPTCEEIFWIAQAQQRLQTYCRVVVAPLEQMHRLHSKWAFIQCAQQYGLTVPDTFLLKSVAEAKTFLSSHAGRYVLKPVYSRFGGQVRIIDTAQQQHFPDQLEISEQRPWVAQTYLEGQAFCTYSVAHEGRILAHVVYPVHYTAGKGACIYFTAVQHGTIDEWVTRFVAREGFSGQIAFDMIVAHDGIVYPLECNPRATSGVHLFSDSQDLVHAFTQQQASLPLRVAKPRMITIAMFAYGPPWTAVLSRVGRWLRALWCAQDVIWDREDRLPFWYQPRLLWYNWRASRRLGVSILDFSTFDIEWNGPELFHG